MFIVSATLSLKVFVHVVGTVEGKPRASTYHDARSLNLIYMLLFFCDGTLTEIENFHDVYLEQQRNLGGRICIQLKHFNPLPR